MAQDAIVVRAVRKRYSKNQPAILDSLDMTVPRGCIYGLLGASGCGKTTLLSCVVGVRKIDAGEIWVLGGKPGSPGSGIPGPRVGYMPQDISLVQEFSCIGALYYFGRINGLNEETIDERFDFFSDLLELPHRNRLVKQMSGGQQRRVSFAAALLHRPELLILDEPTVGLDPILREKIWNFLVKITREEGTAVVITTHYIEEAKLANRIGLMRKGQLLAETTPDDLLAKFQCSSLEDAFLQLSQRQDDTRAVSGLERVQVQQDAPESLAYPSTVSSTNDLRGSTDCFVNSEKQLLASRQMQKRRSIHVLSAASRKIFKALLIKNIFQFIRHPGGILFAFIFPLVQLTLFFYAVGGDPKDIVMGVVNDEAGDCRSGSYTGAVIYEPSTERCSYVDLSCRFLAGFDEGIMLKRYYDTLEEATRAVHEGRASGTMYFARNFSLALLKRMDEFNSVQLSERDIADSEIQTALDMGDRQIGMFLQKNLFERFLEIHQDIVETCDISRKYADTPIYFEEPIYGAMDRRYSNFIAPGVILTITFLLATAVSSSIIIADRAEGVWDRSLVQGVTTWEILLSHFVTQLLMIIIQVSVVLIVVFGHFHLPSQGPFAAIAGIILLTGVCGMSFGFLISVLCTSQTVANFMATGSFYPIVLLSGTLWPLEGMSPYLRWISYVMPTTVSSFSLRCLMDKGYPFHDPDVYSGFIVTVTWILGLFGLCILGIKNKKS